MIPRVNGNLGRLLTDIGSSGQGECNFMAMLGQWCFLVVMVTIQGLLLSTPL